VGTGTLYLNGTNTYTGTTVVTSGTLGGTGTYAGSVTVSATGAIAPGSSIGTMTIASNLSLAGITVMEINRTNLPNADLLDADGAVTYGGTLTVVNTGDALQGGDTFNLFDGLSFGGTFAATNLPALTGALTWDLSQLAVNGTITVVAPVTTPATIVDITYGPGGTNVQLSGTNGQPSATYRVFTEIDMTVPYTNWLPIATNTFDGSGNFIINFPVTPGDNRRFYYIRFP
jgi:autotransporter-associated beta strand protein